MANASSSTTTSSDGNLRQPTARLAFSDPSIGTEIEPPTTVIDSSEMPFDPSLDIDGKRSLANIGLQAFWLGFTFAASIILGALTIYFEFIIWRLLAFMGVLSVFHFLEYWSTARFNVTIVQSSSFLLFTNGTAYNVAYGLAVLEIFVSIALPTYGRSFTSAWSRWLGLFLILVGQIVRTIAMAQAGTNFNHIPQKVRKNDHVLVTRGMYHVFRHPAYFGFFWWAVGTQLLVGNKVCVIGYLLVLWRFFFKRIQVEEKSLIEFFGDEYRQYRAKTRTGIPFVP